MNYILRLDWDSIRYIDRSKAEVINARFVGNVLKNAYKLNEKDNISIDITDQFFVASKTFHIFRFEWNGLEYSDDNRVNFKKSWFVNDFGNLIKIQDSDYLLIDTKDHDERMHPFNINYKAKLYNKDNEIRGY